MRCVCTVMCGWMLLDSNEQSTVHAPTPTSPMDYMDIGECLGGDAVLRRAGGLVGLYGNARCALGAGCVSTALS